MKERTKNKRELGLYIHIPFCMKKCNYCDFLSFSSTEEEKERYVQALCKEILSFQGKKGECIITTMFFGGGTPSILKGEQMERIMGAINEAFLVDEEAEITIEMNPGTVTKEKLEIYKKIGINRLSIGLQTTDDERLKVLGRIHTYEQFLQNYQWARELGFQNISVDLMSALPKEDLTSYQKDLERILALKPEHISSYSLIIEEGTPFYEEEELLEQLPKEEEDRAMYELTGKLLQEEGYQRYEISNYAKKGKESRHNSIYWTGKEYLGLGLGASSYLLADHPYMESRNVMGQEEQREKENYAESMEPQLGKGSEEEEGKKETEEIKMIEGIEKTKGIEALLKLYGYRFKNGSEFDKYCEKPDAICKEREEFLEVTEKDAMEEFMFLGLRMMKGVKKSEFFEKFSVEMEEVYGAVIEKFQAMGLLEEKGDVLSFTKKGIDVSNLVLCEFLMS